MTGAMAANDPREVLEGVRVRARRMRQTGSPEALGWADRLERAAAAIERDSAPKAADDLTELDEMESDIADLATRLSEMARRAKALRERLVSGDAQAH